jgi:CoA:oxalate CoA-transferase
MAGPLNGVIVLDFTWALAGPFGTLALADLGAEVWKIEHVDATEQNRGGGPVVDGINTYFFSVNRGKKSLAIDLKTEEGRAIVYALARQADVLTENFSPGSMVRLGFGYPRLALENPRLIYASTSGFGQSGPYRERGAVDVIVQGMAGTMSITGEPDGPPLRAGYSIGDMAGGLYTAIGVLAALVERNRSGLGQQVDVAMLDAQVALLENAVARYFATGEVAGRIGSRHPLLTPFQAFPTADGWIVIAGVKDWQLFCALLGRDDLLLDQRFADNGARTRNHAALEPLLNATFRSRDSAYWLATLADACLVGPLNTVAQMAADPQVRARQMLVELPAWTGRSFTVSGQPIKLSRTPAELRAGADAPGGHTAWLLRERLGYSAERIADLARRRIVALDPRDAGEA